MQRFSELGHKEKREGKARVKFPTKPRRRRIGRDGCLESMSLSPTGMRFGADVLGIHNDERSPWQDVAGLI